MIGVISVSNMTKDYGHKRGVFDISFEIKKGEIYGFLGPNGAGKSTTIRHLMGFSKPQKGSCKIFGNESFRYYFENMKSIGYVPGEIALPVGLTGWEFIDMNKKMKGIKDGSILNKLLDMFSFDPAPETKSMSLGEKRKLAIITAFMGDPDVLILDEPTSGLDPIMQDVFIDLIKLEKQKGKTIMLSSHMFNEIDATCDRIAIIKDGRIVSEFVADDLRHANQKTYKITDKDGTSKIMKSNDAQINDLISKLADNEIVRFEQQKETLEEYFIKYYKADKDYRGAL